MSIRMKLSATLLVLLGAILGSIHSVAQAYGSEAGRYVANGDVVFDTVTGLVWRRCSEGQVWTGSSCSGREILFSWQGALERAKSAALGGTPWRLPNAKELSSIVDDSKSLPMAIDEAAFPNTPSSLFWTSTYYTSVPSVAADEINLFH